MIGIMGQEIPDISGAEDGHSRPHKPLYFQDHRPVLFFALFFPLFIVLFACRDWSYERADA